FFSSRRRHTRCLSDWSSDVCSSDLIPGHVNWRVATYTGTVQWDGKDFPDEDYNFLLNTPDLAAVSAGNVAAGEQQSIALEFYSKIGRASCRERVEIALVGGAVEDKR